MLSWNYEFLVQDIRCKKLGLLICPSQPLWDKTDGAESIALFRDC
jgi:hypothetical protein